MNPIWLYGLLGLAVPVLIHLWSKKEGKTIKVGSIRFFPESETRQSRRISPNELLLLLIRSLLVAFLVMLIAQPIMISNQKKERPTILIEAALLDDTQVAALLDTAIDGDYSIKLLSQGLPDYGEELVDTKPLSYWEAIKQIEQLPSNEVLIYAQNRASAFKGKLPSSSKRISWYHIPPKDPLHLVISAKQNKEQYQVVVANFEEEATSIERRLFNVDEPIGDLQFQRKDGQVEFKTSTQVDWTTVEVLEPIAVNIRYASDFEVDKRLWEAALNALWKTNGIPIEGVSSENIDAEVGLTIEIRMPDSDALTIRYQADDLSRALLKETAEGFSITRRLSLENVTSENAAEELLTKIFKDDSITQQLEQYDQRSLNTSLIEPLHQVNAQLQRNQDQAIPDVYWVLFMALMGFERVLSFRRKQ